MNLKELKNKNIITGLFFAVLVASIYTYGVFEMTEAGRTDYRWHAKWAEELLSGGMLLPHFLNQIVLIFINKITGLNFIYASYLAVFLSIFATCIVAFQSLKASVAINKYMIALGVVFLLLSHPIAILAPLDKHLYLGYITANVYHNPTLLLLMPIALLDFILVCELLGDELPSDQIVKKASLITFLTALSIIAKPNYIIVLLPAVLGYLIVKRFLFKCKTNKQEVVLTFSVVVPTVLLLTWQYLFFYGSGSKNEIGVDLFAFFMVYSELWTLVPKLLLSIAFPISVAFLLGRVLYFRKDFQLSFLMFCISLVYAYAFVERMDGGGVGNGNFYWSAQIAHFILLYVCIKSYLTFLSEYKGVKQKLLFLPMLIGVCHLLFWLPWYYSTLNAGFWLHL